MRKNDSLTVEIAGGLGNQLFMFYAGLFFQEYYQRAVTFDISDFSRIGALHPGANIQTLGLLQGLPTISISPSPAHPFGRVISTLKRTAKIVPHRRTFVAEEIGFIDPELLPPTVERIRGYFQTWFYFNSIRNKPILSVENLQNPSDWLIDKLDAVKRERVLSVHVRRGDYALPANRSNGILAGRYYETAISQRSNYDRIWVFTDSPNEVEREFSDLNFAFELVTPQSDADPVESLILMSATKQIVISNSTFSWWSAMLASDSTLITAPSKWYELQEDPSKLIPDSWNRVKSDWIKQ